MASKSIHSTAGILVGLGLCFYVKAQGMMCLEIMAGALLGASAPDWLEIARWRKQGGWFFKKPDVRESLIPHRTITHTFILWWLGFVYACMRFFTSETDSFNWCLLSFAISGLTHLFLDVITPMGIPFFPFGKRYHLKGLRLMPGRVIQKRSGWFK